MRYIIFAPNFSKSAGVRALYRLSELLEARGLEAPVLCEKGDGKHHCITQFTREMQENDIIIYPEIIKGNPLLFRRVVRYVLYYPGVLGGDERYAANEYVITWDAIYLDGVPVLNLPLMDANLFYDEHLPKTQNCIFIHKGGIWRDIPELKSAVHITMDYPKDREELASLLKTTDILYSYDKYSMLNDEAFACGANVKIITEHGFEDYQKPQEFDPVRLEEQLNSFVQATGQMKASSPVSPFTRAERLFFWYKLAQYHILARVWNSEKYQRRIRKYRFQLGLPCD